MDGTPTPCKEDITKSQRYNDAIRLHDLRIRRKGLTATVEKDLCLLSDVGQRVVEVFEQPALSSAELFEIKGFARHMSEAMINGIKIEHKQDILVHMSFPDD
ncbi:unnamed protein product [Gongylonema pulchrum]|uniref:Uncharacterized protein n=1 Tax=Gongylonema pulchrum TaxID=637853 RepID=A0A3P7RA15_9BILA|nr:unnamed protein product [Gongylonema pulchrum]